MPLHLVGETIDRKTAYAAAQREELISPYRGIYVDAGDNIDKTILDHAARIASFLYPQAYLSGASAFMLGPTQDGRLFLSGRRNKRTRIRGLEIIQVDAPPHPSTVSVLVGDDMGDLDLKASSPRQRFLEAFRQRSEHANAITPDMRRHMADRLIDEYGDAATAANEVWALGRVNQWIKEAGSAEHFLNAQLLPTPVNKAAVNLVAAWHGTVIGNLSHDGAEWRWTPDKAQRPALVRETHPGSLPAFIEALLPEGWLAQVLDERDDRETLRNGARYMSNMAIVAHDDELAALPADILHGRLAMFTVDGLFSGRYLGPAKETFEDSFQQKLARLFTERTPRLSGVQIKAPMHLRPDGDLVPATDEAFTHILKPAGTNGFEHLPIVEWICLSLAREALFEVPEVALIDMPGGMAPALLVERFDIRRSGNDTRRLALEDFCSVLDQPASRKYDSTIEKMARGLRPLSTHPLADLETLFRRAMFSWLVADGDMHLKNLALLKIADAGSDHFTQVRFAPAYDIVTTIVFPGLETDRMALKLSGKDSRLTPDDFLRLARTIELPQDRASELMAICARKLIDASQTLQLPEKLARTGERMLDRIRALISERAEPYI